MRHMIQLEYPHEIESLSNEIGKFIHHWGFKKIHGKIWTHLYLSETPLDAGTLMKRLDVSKALMSLSLRDLLKYKVIIRAFETSRRFMRVPASSGVSER